VARWSPLSLDEYLRCMRAKRFVEAVTHLKFAVGFVTDRRARTAGVKNRRSRAGFQ
jgi:hypothetical protein